METVSTPPTHATQINADYPLTVIDEHQPRARVAQWMTLRMAEPGISNTEIARRLGISAKFLQSTLTRAVREGWLKFDDPLSRIDHEIIPKVLDNVNQFLDEKDRTVTIETAKGVLFPIYRESKGILDAPQTVLALKIEPTEPSQVKALAGTIVGKPKELKEHESPS